MAYTTINKSTDNFNTVTFNGTGQSSVTGVGFTPDMFIHKNRGNTQSWGVIDVVRGNGNYLGTNSTNAQLSDVGNYGIATDGYTFSNNDQFYNSGSMVYWNWKAGGTGSSNSDGSITSTVSANQTAGFSIVSWTGSNANATIGHGLGVVPKMIIFKNRATATSWMVYNATQGATKFLRLNTTDAVGTGSTPFNDTAPTSSVFSVGANGDTNGSSQAMIAYCFAEKTGYSKFGSYTGNGNADGTFVYTGFKPAFVMVKQSSGTGFWTIIDNKRPEFNPASKWLYPNNSDAEYNASSYPVDFLSNGFKNKSTGSYFNSSGSTYIYMAIGQSLVGSNNIPCTAR